MDKRKTVENIARNLAFLLERTGLEATVVAQRAGIGVRTLTYMKSGRGNPTAENVDAVAKVFGVTGWHLLSPTLPRDYENLEWFERVGDVFDSSSPEMRDMLRKAMEAAEAAIKNRPQDGKQAKG